jgi:hypothetical protein
MEFYENLPQKKIAELKKELLSIFAKQLSVKISCKTPKHRREPNLVQTTTQLYIKFKNTSTELAHTRPGAL